MTSHSILSVVAGAAARSVVQHDAVGPLDRLLEDGVAALGASTAGILVCDARGRLELLAATSHAAADLEIYYSQRDEGPCVDCVKGAQTVAVHESGEITRRWPSIGPSILALGYSEVHASPLRWLGEAFGALNVFYRAGSQPGPDSASAERALADAATLLIVTSGTIRGNTLSETLEQALEGRAVVEQAKGALGLVRSLDMSAAFDALRTAAETSGTPLSQTARGVLDRARRGRLT